eukprot:9036869-Pyramimonas_sp.AAC.1
MVTKGSSPSLPFLQLQQHQKLSPSETPSRHQSRWPVVPHRPAIRMLGSVVASVPRRLGSGITTCWPV